MTQDKHQQTDSRIDTTTRRGALAALGGVGLLAALGGSAQADVGGGDDADELSHLLKRFYEGPESELPQPGVEGRRYLVTDSGGQYKQWTILRDDGASWDAINAGFGSVHTDSLENVADHIVEPSDDVQSILANDASPGDVVFLGSGVHVVSPDANDRGLDGLSNVVLTGQGRETVIKAADGQDSAFSVVEFFNESDFIVQNLTVDGNRTGHTFSGTPEAWEGLSIQESERFTLRNIWSKSAVSDGFDIKDSREFTAKNIYAWDNGKTGVHPSGPPPCEHGTFDGVFTWDNGQVKPEEGAGFDMNTYHDLRLDNFVSIGDQFGVRNSVTVTDKSDAAGFSGRNWHIENPQFDGRAINAAGDNRNWNLKNVHIENAGSEADNDPTIRLQGPIDVEIDGLTFRECERSPWYIDGNFQNVRLKNIKAYSDNSFDSRPGRFVGGSGVLVEGLEWKSGAGTQRAFRSTGGTSNIRVVNPNAPTGLRFSDCQNLIVDGGVIDGLTLTGENTAQARFRDVDILSLSEVADSGSWTDARFEGCDGITLSDVAEGVPIDGVGTEDLGASPTTAPTAGWPEGSEVRNSNADNNETWKLIGGTWVQTA